MRCSLIPKETRWHLLVTMAMRQRSPCPSSPRLRQERLPAQGASISRNCHQEPSPALLKPFPVGRDIPEASTPGSSSCSEGRVGVWEVVTFPAGSALIPAMGQLHGEPGLWRGSSHDSHSRYSTPAPRRTQTPPRAQPIHSSPEAPVGNSSSPTGTIPIGTPPARGTAAAGWAVRDAGVEFQEDGAGLGAFVRSPLVLQPF